MDYNRIRQQEQKNRNSAAKPIIILSIISAVLLISALSVGVIKHRSKQDISEAAPSPAAVSQSAAAPAQSAANASEQASAAEPTPAPTPEPTPTPAPVISRGTRQPIPENVRARMEGVSMHSNNNIGYGDLAYLTIPHYDFNYNVVNGEMVVNSAVADDVLDIFEELFEIKYPIERMELVDNYGGNDFASIEANNTSAFNYRVSTDGGTKLSNHAYGRAIDINPQINPYVASSGKGSHSNAAEYWSRDYQNWSSPVARAAYIGPEAEIYKIFIAHGWTWGGSWSSYRDYQHFEKR